MNISPKIITVVVTAVAAAAAAILEDLHPKK